MKEYSVRKVRAINDQGILPRLRGKMTIGMSEVLQETYSKHSNHYQKARLIPGFYPEDEGRETGLFLISSFAIKR